VAAIFSGLRDVRNDGRRDGDQKVKISKNQLLQIIKEELQSVLKESVPPALAQLMDDRETLERVLPTLHTKAAKDMIANILDALVEPKPKEKPMEFPPTIPPERLGVSVGGAAKTVYTENQKRNKRNK